MPKSTFYISLLISLVILIFWELHWRSAGYRPYVDDNDDLWAYWFRKIPELNSNDVLILGSSRAHFDIDLYEWERLTGKRPTNLAFVGSSPGPMLKYIAEESDFAGTIIVGVSPDLFFDLPGQFGWNRLQKKLDHARGQTYAQRLNQHVYQFIDPHLAYLNDNLLLEGLVEEIPFPPRDSVQPGLFWPDMSVCDENRNLRMIPEMATDTAMQNQYKRIWSSFGWQQPDTNQRDSILELHTKAVREIQYRGGNVIFLRAPISGKYLDYETRCYPRHKYWDELLKRTGAKGVHYADYRTLSTFECPEWSHLLASDALVFTHELVEILEKENLIPKE